jgi:hypothetical protein
MFNESVNNFLVSNKLLSDRKASAINKVFRLFSLTCEFEFLFNLFFKLKVGSNLKQ